MSEVRNADLSSLRINREPVREKSGSPLGKIITIFVIIAALAAAWYYFSTTTFSAIEVETATASLISPSQSNAVLTASGYVVAQRKAAVSSKVAGRLVSLNVIEGDVVKQKQIIGRIESADVEAVLAQLRAASELAAADVDNAQAELDDAKIDLARKSSLFEQKSVSRMEFDVANARYRRAMAGIAARTAAVKMADANIRNAEVQVDNTIIRSPFDGTVLTKNANVGEVITALGASAGSRGAVVTIADMNSLEVEADVSESNIERIAQDQACEVSLDAYPDKRYRATVSKIIPTADRAKATVQVKVRFTERDARVLPEMSAKVLFLKPNTEVADSNAAAKLLVPSAAVITKDSRKFVYKVVDEVATEVTVETGEVSNGFTELKSGIKPGDKVIIRPSEKIRDGSKIAMKK